MDAPSPLHVTASLIGAQGPDAVILTPNQRAARTLRQSLEPAPQILALETWFQSQWHQLQLEGHASALLLNPTQELYLWRAILAADQDLPSLSSRDSLADLAARAWRLTCLYNGRTRLDEFGVSTDTRAFLRWAREFERRARAERLISAAQLPSALADALAQGVLSMPNQGLTLVDTDQLPPAIADLFEAIERAGYPVIRTNSTVASKVHLHAAEDLPQELRAAARWARQHLEANPAARLALVVPDLAARRPQLERALGEHLAPALYRITDANSPLPYEFSLGTPLADTPAGAAALILLRWPLNPLPFETISTLLLSPWFGAASQRASEFDAFTLRQLKPLRPELSLLHALDLLRPLPDLHHRLRSLHHLAHTQFTGEKPHAEWADVFRRLLTAAGWDRPADLDSLAFQTHARWESALDELATLDFTDSSHRARPTATEALDALTRIARQTIFAPESRSAPLQVLGPLELGGVPFDALWFLGADDLAWPPPTNSHPLIPWPIQRSLGMPGAHQERDDEHARTLTRRIAGSAPEVIFSYARFTDEGERRPSAILEAASLGLASLEPLTVAPPHLPEPTLALILFPDDTTLAPHPAHVQGGASVLRLQAACAFRAFAERRLASTGLDSREPGLDPAQQGTLIHKVMELFWKDLGSQINLRALTGSERRNRLAESIEHALDRLLKTASNPWDEAYLDIQRRRLSQLLEPWLDFELTRPEFTVREQEEKKAIHIGPLTLDLRVDRIDDTDGGPLILDYKTGVANPADWLSDRPNEPQLPLYAILQTEPIGGLAFAQLRAGDGLRLSGFTDQPNVLAEPARIQPQPLAEQIEDWRTILTRLAIAFAEGDTQVDPKRYPQTCKHCGQRILCRLNPATLDPNPDDLEPNLNDELHPNELNTHEFAAMEPGFA